MTSQWMRNTTGLREASLKRRVEARMKVDKAIQTLIREEKAITFNAVVTLSGVSKSWIYKQPEIRQQIELLRQQTPSLPQKQRKLASSDDSKDSMIRALREQVKQLKADKKALEKQLEVVYGLLNDSDSQALEQQNRRLVEELERSQQLLDHAVKDHQSTIEQNKRLRAQNKEGQALRSALEGMEQELAQVKKQNQHLMTQLQRVQAEEREKGIKGFAAAIGHFEPIPDVEY